MTAAFEGRPYDVCVFGLGPVGAVSAACYARQGFSVLGIDIDANRLRMLEEGHAPFVEPGMDELIRDVRESGRFQISSDFLEARHAQIIVIAVGTPTGEEPDLSQLDKVCAQAAAAIQGKKDGTILVIRSTIPPGTIRNRLTPIVESVSGLRSGADFHMASNPEFLREGTAIKDFFKTGRIIIGCDSELAAAQIEALYREVDAGSRLHVSLEAAEFAKYVDNTWHALKVSFANEIGRVCQAFGGTLEESTEIFLSDNRLNVSANYLRPGFAFGGSCLPKDVRGLSWLASGLGVEVPVIRSILPSNYEHIMLGVDAILEKHPRKAGLLGVAFKEHVDDLRESPALAIAAQLMDYGVEVVAHDPAYLPGNRLDLPHSYYKLDLMELEALADASDVLVIMHRLPLYYALAARRTNKPVVDLTKFPAASERPSQGKKTFMSAKSAFWSFGDAHSGPLPPKKETKKMPSIDIPGLLRKTIPG